MIAVIEGITAAGKTTWCRRHARGITVWEPSSRLRYLAPPGSTPEAAPFWAEVQSRRWATALRVESRAGVAVCDSDPLRLHYVWSRWQVGHAERVHFEREAAAARQRVVLGRLGFADLVVVARADEETARANARRDGSRSRSGFELHVQLGGPLHRWYATLDELSPGHVVWSLPEAGLLALPPRLRATRSDVDLFDRLVARLA
jgi:hypothetical protein